MKRQQGEILTIIAILVAVLLVAVVGWVVYEKVTGEQTQNSPTVENIAETDTQQTTPVYKDYRTNGDSTGKELKTEADVKALEASDKLKVFFTSGLAESIYPIVDRVQGSYAVGLTSSNAGAYVVWGPEGGTGEIKVVAGTQNVGFKCDDLKAAKVPSKLVDNKCYKFDGSADNGAEEYNQQ